MFKYKDLNFYKEEKDLGMYYHKNLSSMLQMLLLLNLIYQKPHTMHTRYLLIKLNLNHFPNYKFKNFHRRLNNQQIGHNSLKIYRIKVFRKLNQVYIKI